MKDRVIGMAVAMLARTWRIEVGGAAYLAHARSQGPVLYAPWHEALIPLVWHHRHQGITLLVGRHTDAGILAAVAARLGYRLARGSSSRGGTAGLKALIRALGQGGEGAVTPDGPRGPRRLAKAGAVLAAQRTGAVIVPVTADVSAAWRLNSWDRMLVPHPGARVVIRYGPGLAIARHGDPRDEPVARLQAAMDALAAAS